MIKVGKNNSGYSLTEILLAVLIFATTLTPLIQLFIQSTREAENAIDSYKVSNLLSMEIEALKSLLAIQPAVFKHAYPSGVVIEKKREKYDIKVKVMPRHLISTVSAHTGQSVSARVVEVEAEANWKTGAGRLQKLVFHTSL